MLDIKKIINEQEHYITKLNHKGFQLNIESLKDLYDIQKNLKTQKEALQNQRNEISKKIGFLKKNKENSELESLKVKKINDEIDKLQQNFKKNETELFDLLSVIPNIPHESSPVGKDESENVVKRSWNKVRKFDFKVKDHVELTENLGLIDFEIAAKISKNRFAVLKRDLAKLQRALAEFMLDVHIKEHNYEEIYVPFLVNSESLFATGQLPKFKEDLFNIDKNFDLSLIPTAEVSLTNLVKDKILDIKDLPIKLISHTPCFRSEAGSYGKDIRGLIRQHQFQKVELVNIVHHENSFAQLEIMTAEAEKILKLLNLPYRVIELCTGDLGFCSAKTYDLEVWVPSQNAYREISSCSNMTDFQARRMKTRVKIDNKKELVHTLNGSALAIGRCLVAILENYQNKDGSINIPEALIPYMNSSIIK